MYSRSHEIVRIAVRNKFLWFCETVTNIVVDYDNEFEIRNASYHTTRSFFSRLGDFSRVGMVGLCERREDVADTLNLPRERNP